jgi:hypothetical protein
MSDTAFHGITSAMLTISSMGAVQQIKPKHRSLAATNTKQVVGKPASNQHSSDIELTGVAATD